MKLLFENWRQYLKEESNAFPYQIYCDMDGVLVDLIGGVLNYSKGDSSNKGLRKQVKDILKIGWGWTKPNPELQEGLDYINDIVSNDVDFWASLPSMPDKDKLWSYISQYDPIILSHPWDDASKEGKRIWIENNLVPQPVDEIYTRDKYIHAMQNKVPNILIDDFTINTIPWEEHGGIAILHTDTSDTIKELEELMNESSF